MPQKSVHSGLIPKNSILELVFCFVSRGSTRIQILCMEIYARFKSKLAHKQKTQPPCNDELNEWPKYVYMLPKMYTQNKQILLYQSENETEWNFLWFGKRIRNKLNWLLCIKTTALGIVFSNCKNVRYWLRVCVSVCKAANESTELVPWVSLCIILYILWAWARAHYYS